MMNNNTTPGKAAKAWAKAHPDFVGVLEVLSHTHKGRGGWKGLATRTNTFFVRDGKSAQSRDGKDHVGFNGICWVCGRIYLDAVLSWAYGPDPQAGEPVPDGEIWRHYRGESFVYHEHADMHACPACIEEHGLAVGFLGAGPYRGGQSWVRVHPMATKTTAPTETLDIRSGDDE